MDDNKDQPLNQAIVALSMVAIAGFVAMLVYGANIAISARIVHLPNVVRIITAWCGRSWEDQAGAGDLLHNSTTIVRDRSGGRQGQSSA
jgi:hypothetical protein